MGRLLYFTLGTLFLLIPRPILRWARIGDDDESVYMLHLGVKWLGYGFMMSLSCTDFHGLKQEED